MQTLSQIKLSELPEAGVPNGANAVAECYLVRIHPPGLSENLIPLRKPRTTIGRDETSDIEVVDDFTSRHHATLERIGGSVWVIDHGSRNGTFVNDERIDRRQLRAGDHVRVGNRIYKFLSADHPELQYHEAVYQMMTSDGLTNVANRRFFDDSFHRELVRCMRHSRPIAVLLLDIDHFKRINDLYGHLVGDECLRELCDRVQSVIRIDDLFARIGGEEFAIVITECGVAETRICAERVRSHVAAQPFGRGRRLEIPLTVSIGIAHSDGTSIPSTEEFLSSADKHLYRAKHEGRNRVAGPEGH